MRIVDRREPVHWQEVAWGLLRSRAAPNAISRNLYLGYYAADSGTYNLSGSGLLLVSGTEYAGYHGGFMQTGGENTVACLSISTNGRYLLGGGTLQVGNGGLSNFGIFDGGNGPGTLIANGILDMTKGTWQDLEATSVNMSSNGLLIVPAGFNTSTRFGSYSTLGLTYTTDRPSRYHRKRFQRTDFNQRSGRLPRDDDR